MKKIILGLVVASFIGLGANSAKAQGSVGLEVGGGLPMYAGDGLGFGLGFGVTGDFMLSNELSLGALFSYQMLSFETNGISLSMLPMVARVGYYLTPEFVVGADVGFVMSRTSYDATLFPAQTNSSSSDFAVGAHAGFSSDMGFGAEVRWLHVMSDDAAGLLQFVANYKFMF